MRQDVFVRQIKLAWPTLRQLCGCAVLCGALAGCQLTAGPQLPNEPERFGPAGLTTSLKSNVDHETDEGRVNKTTRSPAQEQAVVLPALATSRGLNTATQPAPVVQAAGVTTPPRPQLSNAASIRGQSGSWDDGSAGSDENSRNPMVATDTTKLSVPPAFQQPPSNPVGYGLQPPPSASAPSPLGSGGYYAASPQVGGVLPPPSALPGGYGVNDPYGYGAAGTLAPSPSDAMGAAPYGGPGAYGAGAYGATVAPGAILPPNTPEATLAPGIYGDPLAGIGGAEPLFPDFRPNVRIAPLDVYVQEGRTGRVVLGGSVNSDLGVAGQLIIEERNFDIRKFPRGWGDVRQGRAFRGAGENFRAELMPGNLVERYTVSWATPNLFGYLPYSLSVGGFYFTRQFRDWTEQRIGGRVALGYEITKDLSISSEIRLEDVKLFDPIVSGIPELDSALGSNDIYTARFRIAHDTRDSPFMATEGALLELVYDQVFGEYDYPRGQINYSRYFLMRERPDGTGRHTLASTWRVGLTGSQTPVFENFFAGGFSTLRGFSFRGASPTINNVQVGGELMFLGSLEYMFPLTADEMLRGVAFVDYGTVEQDLEIRGENFRVAPGLGLRVQVPALGPAPLAFDFAYPINYADTDDRQIFSFHMGFTR